MIRRVLVLSLAACLIFQQSSWSQAAGPGFDQGFRPVHLRYLGLLPSGDFKLLLDRGDAPVLNPRQVETMAAELMGYFQIGLRLPNALFWVNLRPDGQDRIIDPLLERTDVGRIMLEADLQLKKDLARMTDPATPEGRRYWQKIYSRAEALYGPAQDIEIPTLARPWIVPGQIIVGEGRTGAYVYKATLAVMLEEDHLRFAGQRHALSDPRQKELNAYAAELIRASFIPRLCRQVNAAPRYAPLRQVYYSLILAQWYKQRSKNPLIDSKDLSGLASASSWSKETYFKAYRDSFQRGEYRSEEAVAAGGSLVLRQYVCGGEKLDTAGRVDIVSDQSGTITNFFDAIADLAYGLYSIVVPGTPAPSGQERIDIAGERLRWQDFLRMPQSVALYKVTDSGLHEISGPAAEDFLAEPQLVRNAAQDLAANPLAGEMMRPFFTGKEDTSYSGSKSGLASSADIFFRKIRVNNEEYIAVATADPAVQDLAFPASSNMVVHVSGAPGTEKSRLLAHLQEMYPGIVVPLVTDDRLQEAFRQKESSAQRGGVEFDFSRAQRLFLGSGKVMVLSVDDFVLGYIYKAYELAGQGRIRLDSFPGHWKEELERKGMLPDGSIERSVYCQFLTEKLGVLKQRYGATALQPWFRGEAGAPAFFKTSEDAREWEEIARRFSFRWFEMTDQEIARGDRNVALFDRDQVRQLDARARDYFDQVERELILEGYDLLIETSGFNPAQQAMHEQLAREDAVRVREVFMFRSEQAMVGHIAGRNKVLDYLVFAGVQNNDIQDYYLKALEKAMGQLRQRSDYPAFLAEHQGKPQEKVIEAVENKMSEVIAGQVVQLEDDMAGMVAQRRIRYNLEIYMQSLGVDTAAHSLQLDVLAQRIAAAQQAARESGIDRVSVDVSGFDLGIELNPDSLKTIGMGGLAYPGKKDGGDPDRLGGVDFRLLPSVATAAPQVDAGFWQQMAATVGQTPVQPPPPSDAAGLERYFVSCCLNNTLESQRSRIAASAAALLRSQETAGVEEDSRLDELLVLLHRTDPVKEGLIRLTR